MILKIYTLTYVACILYMIIYVLAEGGGVRAMFSFSRPRIWLEGFYEFIIGFSHTRNRLRLFSMLSDIWFDPLPCWPMVGSMVVQCPNQWIFAILFFPGSVFYAEQHCPLHQLCILHGYHDIHILYFMHGYHGYHWSKYFFPCRYSLGEQHCFLPQPRILLPSPRFTHVIFYAWLPWLPILYQSW
jgi:hypothetical protein